MNRTRALLRCGAAAGPLLVGTSLVAGARRPSYDPLRHPISSLALGPGGWVQSATFAVTGGLLVAGAVGLQRLAPGPAVPALIGTAGVGLIGSAVFVTDPVSGYPPGTLDSPGRYSSTTGALHDLAAVPVFLGLPAAAVVESVRAWRRGERRWAAGCAAATLASSTAFGLASAGFAQHPRLVAYGGLHQRVAVAVALGWVTVVMERASRQL